MKEFCLGVCGLGLGSGVLGNVLASGGTLSVSRPCTRLLHGSLQVESYDFHSGLLIGRLNFRHKKEPSRCNYIVYREGGSFSPF